MKLAAEAILQRKERKNKENKKTPFLESNLKVIILNPIRGVYFGFKNEGFKARQSKEEGIFNER
jgi:hypothetical protein